MHRYKYALVDIPSPFNCILISLQPCLWYIKKEVKAHLMTLFPSTLKGYRSSTRLEGVASDFNGILGIVVGEECLPGILPVAYYECAIRPIENTLDGVDIGGQRVTLSPEAQRTAFLFRQRFRDFVSSSANLAQMLRNAPSGIVLEMSVKRKGSTVPWHSRLATTGLLILM